MGPRCTWLFLFYLICVTDSIKGFSRCRGYWSILLSICRVYQVYVFGWLCRATYCSVDLLRCLVYHMLSKTRNSRSLHRVIAYTYVRLILPSYLLFCCIYFDAWCITWCLKREETLKVYTVIGEEVLVLSLLVVMYKISNWRFHTAVEFLIQQ